MKYPQEKFPDFPIVKNLADINEKEIIGLTAQTMFKRSRQSDISIFLVPQDY